MIYSQNTVSPELLGKSNSVEGNSNKLNSKGLSIRQALSSYCPTILFVITLQVFKEENEKKKIIIKHAKYHYDINYIFTIFYFFPITEMKLLDASVCRIKYVCCNAITFSLFNPFFHVELNYSLN